ncbi:putative deacetylase LmbE-like domain-containing protein [Crassisporium funariophilum]|nr:putative deacetylase LmbE-like domain-containing protein [Crassisporium funariophilum]
MFSTASLSVLLLSLLVGSLYTPLDSNSSFVTQKTVTENAFVAQKILLVTAHPDDEAMFFAPTILSLTGNPTESSADLFHLCLSYGNADGLGETRKTELDNSLDLLGIAPDKRWIIDHPDLQDNITAEWDADVVAKVMKLYVSDLNIDTILTFDSGGVSSHPNHQSLPKGAQNLIKTLASESTKPTPRLFTLVTAPIFTKYISILSVFLGKVDIYSFRITQKLELLIVDILSEYYPEVATPSTRNLNAQLAPVFISGYTGYLKAHEAMRAHGSQMEWFRWLYTTFSRYMWVNTWLEVKA